jgi:hypothetical protein
MPHRDAKEIREQYVSQLGLELGATFHALFEELSWLHFKWRQYRVLFGYSDERVALLNKAAGAFFHVVQRILWDDVLLNIARLTDPARSAGKHNLSFAALPPLIEDAEFRAELSALIQKASDTAGFARDWRNRQLAHKDLDLAISDKARPLPAVSRKHVEDVLEAMRHVFNSVELKFIGSEVAFEHISGPPDDADLLLYALELAMQHEDFNYPSEA